MSRPTDRREVLQMVAAAAALPHAARRQHIVDGGESKPPAGGHHVYPNQPIQDALDAAARDPVKKHANNFTTGGEKSPIESDEIRKTTFFYTDGG